MNRGSVRPRPLVWFEWLPCEAWHAHWRDRGSEHEKAEDDTATLGCVVEMECDDYVLHLKDEYPAGTLWTSDLPVFDEARTPHYAYQVGAEMACDLADLPAEWVPLSARLEAESTANVTGSTRFFNGPVPYNCGVPTPLSGLLALVRSLPPTCANPCAVDSECTGVHNFCV